MANSKLIPLVFLKEEKIPIIQIAKLIINFYQKLALVDANYNEVNIVSEKKALHQNIDINNSNADQHIAEEILNHNIDDIRKVNGVTNPDIYFSRDDMISCALEAKVDKETLLTLRYSFSTFSPRIGSIVVNEVCLDTFEKAKFFLETIEQSFSIGYSVIKIFDRELNKAARSYKAPLGWITYFSNDYEISIPDDLEGIEYEHTDKGKFLILTRDDITTDPVKLETGKQQLLELMEEIKDRVPEYGK